MKIIVALDKFKGSLTAPEACAAVRLGLLAARPDARVVVAPMADGGEGTADALQAALGGDWISVSVTGPLPGTTRSARYLWLERDRRAVVEMAQASGMVLLPVEQRNPLRTTTYGTGELLADAHRRGTRSIWLAVGGSATVDGGVGAAMALGWRFLDAQGQPIGLGGGELERIARIVPPTAAEGLPEETADCRPQTADRGPKSEDRSPNTEPFDSLVAAPRASRVPRLNAVTRLPRHVAHSGAQGLRHRTLNTEHRSPVTMEVLCDVDNPLCGEHGAARVFGPQKGATPAMVKRLDNGLRHLADLVRAQLGKDIRDLRGAGAAGGLGAGAVAFFDARLVPGIGTVMGASVLAKELVDADWVITGEGQLDEQSLRGKVVDGVAAAARSAGVKVAVLAGRVKLSEAEWRQWGIEVVSAVTPPEMSTGEGIRRAAELLFERARELELGD